MSGSLFKVSRLGGLMGSTAMLLAFATAAQAADMPLRYKAPPMVAQAYNWTGFYIGGQVGYADGNDQLMEYLTGPGGSIGAFTGFARKNNVTGVTGGGYAGANYQAGMWVVGLEGDVEGSDLKGGWIDTPTGGQGSTKVDFQGSLRGRIGIASDRVLLFATGGAAFGNVSHTYTNLTTGVVETFANTRTGWTVGGGLEYAMAQNWLVRAEYRYTDYGLSQANSATSFPGLTGTQVVKLNTVRVGLAYKF